MKRNSKTTWRLFLFALAVVPLLFWNFSSQAQKGGPKISANLDQIRNGPASAPIADPDWVNGNAGKSNAHYREGESIAYRMVITGLRQGTSHNLQIEWDVTHSGVNAIDYITYYDRISENPNPCKGISPCVAADTSGAIYNIPTPEGNDLGSMPGQPEASFAALPQAEKKMSIFNGVLSGTGMTYVFEGNLSLAQSATRMNIQFTANASTVVLAWGGHIGSRLDWGTGNSASGISGSPYHTRLISIDGSGGNQDRSLSADAVLPPLNCLIDGVQDVCAGVPATFSSSITGDTYLWEVTSGTATFTGGINNTHDVEVTANANYSLKLTVTKAGFTTGSCPFDVTVHAPPTVSVSLDDGCDPTTVQLTATASAGVTYLWSGPSNNGSTAASITPTAPGKYTVTVTDASNPAGCNTASAEIEICFTVK